MRSLLLFALVILALFSVGFGQSSLDSDFQLWNDNSFVIPLVTSPANGHGKTDKLSLLVLQTNRVGTSQNHFSDERVGLGLDAFVNKHLSISPSYIYRATHSLPTHWQYEHRLRIDGTLSKDWGPLGLKNRARVERLIRNSRTDLNRFRNRSTIRFPLNPKGKHRIDGFGMTEVYYEFTRGLWTILDVGGGVSTKLTNKLSTEIYYIHRGPLKDHVPHVNGIGFNFKLSLD